MPSNIGICTRQAAPAPAVSRLGLLIALTVPLLVGALAMLRRTSDRRP